MMKQPSLVYAGIAERLLANLTDTFIVAVLGTLAAATLGSKDLALPATYAALLLYYTYLTSSPWQATLGKRMLGIRVVRLDSGQLTRRDALERALAYTLPNLPLYTSIFSQSSGTLLYFWLVLVWFVPILLTPERVGMHDRLCRTRVVVGKSGT